MQLQTTLTRSLLSTTQQHIDALNGMGIKTVGDLILYLPRSYEDLSRMDTLESAVLDTKVTISGTVDQIKLVHTKSRKKLVTARFTDSQGQTAEVIWFNQPHITRMLSNEDSVVLTGKLIENGYKLQLQSPQFEKSHEQNLIHAGRLVPVYPQHDIINTKWLREKMQLCKDAILRIQETLPDEVVQQESLLSRSEAIAALHFPENGEHLQKAMERMAFEEMFDIQKEALEQKREWKGNARTEMQVPMDVDLIKSFFSSLNFSPTGSQKVAIYEILKDMETGESMSRLLEGDVGSGKTLVATAVIANVLKAGGQCALMVPTEVLAKQHVVTIAKMLVAFHTHMHKESGVSVKLPTVELLTGSLPSSVANDVKQRLSSGTIDVVIGTHALLTDNVRFKNLLLVIVDEQHRFGVEQRRTLKEKGSPHFLAMTATPIPRTLALTAYGHHDLSVLLEKPGNRLPIHTKVVPPTDRTTVENFIDQQILEGRQAFVICPLIQESSAEEMAEVKSVQQEYKRLQEGFPHRTIGLLHGKLLSQEKEEIMRAFKNKEFDILVSTSVIEVGIDVPNATVIVIEGSERFGLAQLHQFRGRVGRSDHKSHCFLFTTTPQQAKSQRLKAMETHDNGFELAEIDLSIRGPGELFGLRQSGIPQMRAMGLLNPALVVRARRAAEKLIGV